jgi:hypothetical protein
MDVTETLCDDVDWNRDVWRNVMRRAMTLVGHRLSLYQPTKDPLHDVGWLAGHTRRRGHFTSLNSLFLLPCEIQGQWNHVHTSSSTLTPINVSSVFT